MEIRLFKPEDKPKIITLMSEFGDYLESVDPLNKTSFFSNGAEYFTDKLISETSQHNGAIFVAEEAGEIGGFIGGHPITQSEEELMETAKENIGIVSEFFITKQMRSKGIGKKLLQTIETFLKNQGCVLVRLEVFGPNKIARDFYERNGFQERSVTVSKYI